ncbi:MAG: hypothetical protein JWP14_3452 [Frankiales bacterium]|nr:hypothetical protein [Frankiales bacterium]
MKRTLCLLVLVAACSHGTTKATSTPTSPPDASPSATASAPPSATPTASPTRTAAAVVGPVGVKVPSGFRPQSATFVSSRTGWVLGASPCPSGTGSCDVIARTRDGGATWRAIPAPKTTPDHLAQIRFADQANGFVTGDNLWATHDGGATWKVVPGVADVGELAAAAGRVWITTGARLRSAPVGGGAFVAEGGPAQTSTFVLHGSQVVAGSGDNGSLYVGGHGVAFTVRKTPCTGGLGAVPGVAANGRWLLVCSGGAGLGHEEKHAYRSTDSGSTWKAAGDPPQLTGSDLYLTSSADFVVDHQEVAVSRDGDRTWTIALNTDGGLSEGGFESASLGYGIGGFGGSTDQTMKLSDDTGRTWKTVAF